MLKQAFRSYLLSFHPRTRKRAKESSYHFVYRFMGLWLFMVILGTDEMWPFFYQMIPAFIMYWSNEEHGLHLKKPMFWCPMQYGQRKAYVHCLLLFKIGVPLFVGLWIQIIRGVFLGFDAWEIIGKMFCYLSIGIGIFIHMDGIDKTEERRIPARKDKTGKLQWAWMNTATHLVGTILVLEYELFAMAGTGTDSLRYVFGFGVVLLFVWDVIILTTQYKDMIERAVNFELAYQIPGIKRYIESE